MADPPRMTGKSALATGGTGGIGKATAIGLAALGARVGITGRDSVWAEAAATDIRAASGNRAVDVYTGDMSSQAEVRRHVGLVRPRQAKPDPATRQPARPGMGARLDTVRHWSGLATDTSPGRGRHLLCLALLRRLGPLDYGANL